MGHTNAPAIYICMMNNILSNVLDLGIVVFLDDILVYSCTVKEHFTLLKKVLAYIY